MMETASTSEMLVIFYQTTRRYNPEERHLQRREIEGAHGSRSSYTDVTVIVAKGWKCVSVLSR
jgi:hypothetical protein